MSPCLALHHVWIRDFLSVWKPSGVKQNGPLMLVLSIVRMYGCSAIVASAHVAYIDALRQISLRVCGANVSVEQTFSL